MTTAQEWIPRRRRDDGATLIIALVIVTVVAVVSMAVLSHAWTNLQATVALRGVAGTSYAGDAAAKVALNELRLGSTSPDWVDPGYVGSWSTSPGWVFANASDGTGCFGATSTTVSGGTKVTPTNSLELDNLYPKQGDQTAASSARVECTVVPGTGILGGSGGVVIQDPGTSDPNSTNPFARALTTVGTSADPHDGISLAILGSGGNNVATIGGSIASKTNILVDTSHGVVSTSGYVYANGTCTGVVSPDIQCPRAGGIPTLDVPASPLTSVPTAQDPTAVTNCHFPSGYYNSGSALSTAVNSCPVAYFDGVTPYYFDFSDGKPWYINTTVIGGVSTGSSTIPGACVSPIGSASSTGAQFVFGGSSTITLDKNNANVEICGPTNGGQAPMTIYQQQSGTTPASSTIGPSAAASVCGYPFVTVLGSLTCPVAPPAKTDGFTSSDATKTLAQAIAASDTTSANWTSTKKSDMGELDLTGFSGLASIPQGATISSATLNVSYASAPSLSATPAVGVSGIAGTSPLTASTSTTASADIAAQLQELATSGGFNATRPVVQIKIPTSNSGDTMKVDSVSLSVTWRPAALRPTTNTTFISVGDATGPSPASNMQGDFVIEGSVYAPQGYVNLVPGQSSSVISFHWGLVAQGVNFKTQPQQLFSYPLVSIPSPGTGIGGTAIDLKVFVCVAASTCSSGGRQSLIVRALITDPTPDTPVPGTRRIRILSWAEQK